MIGNNTSGAIKICYCYAREDEELCSELEKHLGALKRSGSITTWRQSDVLAGDELQDVVKGQLQAADIILLLISPDFINSDFCWEIEMPMVLERHESGELHAIPIIGRPVDWERTPLSSFLALPTGGKPITNWSNRDEAFQNIARELRKVVEALHAQKAEEEWQKRTLSSSALLYRRPIHIFWILDNSTSMQGSKIQSLNTALREMMPELLMHARNHPEAQIWIQAITFSNAAYWHIAQPTRIEELTWTDVSSGGKRDMAAMGAALAKVAEKLQISGIDPHALPPLLILITDGEPTDNFEYGLKALLDQQWGRRAIRTAVGIGSDVNYEVLLKFSTEEPLRPGEMELMCRYIRWTDNQDT